MGLKSLSLIVFDKETCFDSGDVANCFVLFFMGAGKKILEFFDLFRPVSGRCSSRNWFASCVLLEIFLALRELGKYTPSIVIWRRRRASH
jgi:hypothetical protein